MSFGGDDATAGPDGVSAGSWPAARATHGTRYGADVANDQMAWKGV
ncbi:hypothetical protein UVI_02057330 [Ustilaginoidea virens]|uniref:Uncharacterized protein n=1 Tax=Ustilaginoidea virens TaxID=1159556 RepID=A0A1B5L1D3_USTVR|nr:hypothetical protein UVI_02057330 [Ustilaginoidea virens]